jgi:hypothetical protein
MTHVRTLATAQLQPAISTYTHTPSFRTVSHAMYMCNIRWRVHSRPPLIFRCVGARGVYQDLLYCNGGVDAGLAL